MSLLYDFARSSAFAVVALAMVACDPPHTPEAHYVEWLMHHLAQDPAKACCHTPRTVNPAPSECFAEAEKNCGFVKGAKVTSHRIERLPHDSGAQVIVELSGPSGNGTCAFQVMRGGEVQGGACHK